MIHWGGVNDSLFHRSIPLLRFETDRNDTSLRSLDREKTSRTSHLSDLLILPIFLLRAIMTIISNAAHVHTPGLFGHIRRLSLLAVMLLFALELQAQPVFLRMSAPNGGETLLVDSTYNIRWSSNGLVDTLLYIEYSVDSGAVWQFIDTARGVNGADTLAWVVPNDTSSRAFVRVRLADSSRIGRSARTFAIATVLPPRITVLSPNGGQIYGIDSTINIRWTAQAVTGILHVEYSVDSGVAWKPIGTKPARAGNDTLVWRIPNDTTSTAFVRVRTADTVTSDRSDRTFRIVTSYRPSVKLIYPNGGQVFAPDSLVIVEWEEQDLGANVRVELSVDSGRTWALIGQKAPINGTDTLHWTVPDDSTTAALIRVGRQGVGGPGTAIRDTSDAFFTILAAPPPPPATISSVGPEGGIYAPDSVVQIYWTAANIVGVLRVDYSLDSGASWNQIVRLPGRDGLDSTSWTVPNDSTTTGFFRVSTVDSSVVAQTTIPFTIRVEPVGAGVNPRFDQSSLRMISIAPLPTSGRLTLTWEQKAPSIATLEIHDTRGGFITGVDLGRREQGAWSETIDLSRLTPGLYVARLIAGHATVTIPIVVTR